LENEVRKEVLNEARKEVLNEVRKEVLREVRLFSNGVGTRGSSLASEVRVEVRIFPNWHWIMWLVAGNCG
jgi:hypothetical protein